jgi:SAM-dependent methyltransferase
LSDQQAIISDGPVTKCMPVEMRESDDWQAVKDGWEAPIILRKEREFPATRANALDALRRVEKFTRKGRLLDMGCGAGFHLAAAREAGWQVEGLEPLTGHAVYARAKFGLRVVNDVLRDDTYPDGSFDAITAFQVFEHLPDPDSVMRQLVRALKAGGALLVEVPNVSDPLTKIVGPRSRHFVIDHLNFFNARTLGNLMRKHGLRVVSVHYPTRNMSVRHLGDWLAKYLPVRRLVEGMERYPWLAGRMVRINLRDIVEVIGVK